MQLASALSMCCCCRKSQHLVPMVRATPRVTHLGDGTENMEVQTASLGHSKPHAQNSRCKSHGTPSIHLAFSPFSNPPCVFPLSHLCWIFSISPYKSVSLLLPIVLYTQKLDIYGHFPCLLACGWIQPMGGPSTRPRGSGQGDVQILILPAASPLEGDPGP